MSKFILIAGPCVIENEAITYNIANKIKKLNTLYPKIDFTLKLLLIKQIEPQFILLEDLEIKRGQEF
jgi:hypothetical protein